MVDESPAADAMFDAIVGLADTWLADRHQEAIPDPQAYSALVLMEVGAVTMREQLSRVLGVDVFGPDGHRRLLGTKLDFHAHLLLSPHLARQAHRPLDRLQRLERQTPPTATITPGKAHR